MKKRTKAYHSMNSQNKALKSKLAAYQLDFEYLTEELEINSQETKRWNSEYIEQSTINAELENRAENYKNLVYQYSATIKECKLALMAQQRAMKKYQNMIIEMKQNNKKPLLKKLFGK